MARYFTMFQLRAKSRETVAERFERILQAIGNIGEGYSRLLFLLSDYSHMKTSGVSRIVKAYPELAEFQYHGSLGPEGTALSNTLNLGNFGAPWEGHNPNPPASFIPAARLLEILQARISQMTSRTLACDLR